MAYEQIKIEYDNVVVYTETDQNVVGATTDVSIRTILTHADANCIYVNASLAGASDANAGTAALPKLTIGGGETACDGTHQMITIMDSSTYDEAAVINNANCMTIQANLGVTPTLTRKPGARITSTPTAVTGTERFVRVGGADAGAGTTYGTAWQTIQYALTTATDGDTVTVYGNDTFTEYLTLAVNKGIILRAAQGFTPTLAVSGATAAGVMFKWEPSSNSKALVIDGFIFNGANIIGTYGVDVTASGGTSCTVGIYNCTFLNFKGVAEGIRCGGASSALGTVLINMCWLTGYGRYGIEILTKVTTATIQNCKLHGWTSYGIYAHPGGAASATNITDCLLYANGTNCRVDHDSDTDALTITNCTAVEPSGNYLNGLYRNFDINRNAGSGDTITITGCVAYLSGSGLDFDFNETTTINYTVADWGNNCTWAASSVNGDPSFLDGNNRYYGLQPETNGYHTGNATADYDMGVRWILMQLDRNTTTINGLTFDGGSAWFKGIDHLAAQTATTLKWCTFKNLMGIAVDTYNASATATTTTITSCNINHCGMGVACYGTDAITYSLFYRNRNFSVYEDGGNLTFGNNALYGNKAYGLYFTATGNASQVHNSIFSSTAGYGIYSSVAVIQPMYCAIDDAVNTLVDTTDASNFGTAPYFRNTTDGSEDLHLATVEGGYPFPEGEDNILINAGDDGEDIGAYNVTRVETSNTWSSYTVPLNPVRLDTERVPVNMVERNNTDAVYSSMADAYRVHLTMSWGDDNYMTEGQAEMFEYLGRLHTRMRIYLADSAGLFSAAGTTSATAKTFTPTAAPGWTPMRWAGWWFLFGGVSYKILSNTATALTVDDPDDTLATATATGKITFIEVKRVGSVVVTPQQKYYGKDGEGDEVDRTGFKFEAVEV